MLMDAWQRINYEKEFISSNTNKLDYCPVCHRCVPYFDIHQYIIKNNTESCLKMCYECFNKEIAKYRYR